jgi:magnesium chelatase family protein
MFKIYCSSHFKNDLFCVEVEADVSGGIFRFDIIGLGDRAVEESKLRVLAAIKNSGFKSVYQRKKRITVLLSPAHKKKEGSHFDLAIVLSYLNKIGEFDIEQDIGALGELSLSGEIKSVMNIKSHISQLIYSDIRNIICSSKDKDMIKELVNESSGAEQNSFYTDLKIIFAENLNDAISKVKDRGWVNILDNNNPANDSRTNYYSTKKIGADLGSDTESEKQIDKVVGQNHIKRALMIALSGNHHIMIGGFPGTGKTMLAKSSGELIPKNSDPHQYLKGFNEQDDYLRSQAIFSPHHTISYGKMIGSFEKKGLISSLNNSILVLDEWAEFDRRTLESLRQPLEEGEIFGDVVNFCCIATTNFCPCGFNGATDRKCICTPQRLLSYSNKLHSPVTERFDMYVSTEPYTESDNIYHSNYIKETIKRVRDIQKERFVQISDDISADKFINRKYVRELIYAKESVDEGNDIKTFRKVSLSLKLNPRKSVSLLLLARTIADVDKKKYIDEISILEASGYIRKDFYRL